jgi:hypothetical protein
MLLDEIREPRRRIGLAQRSRRGAHAVEPIGLGEKLRHDRIETRRVAILVEQHNRRADSLERSRVADLVIAR